MDGGGTPSFHDHLDPSIEAVTQCRIWFLKLPLISPVLPIHAAFSRHKSLLWKPWGFLR
jgi:hypothetical protein